MYRGNNDGYDGLTSDYCIHGTPLFFNYIAVLFSTMIKCNDVPKGLCISTMMRVSWNRCSFFYIYFLYSISNGVMQGGVLSHD